MLLRALKAGAFCLSFVQNNVNGGRSEHLTQRLKHELGQRVGRKERDAEKPSVRVKGQDAADACEITDDTLDAVVLQTRGVLGTGLCQPAQYGGTFSYRFRAV